MHGEIKRCTWCNAAAASVRIHRQQLEQELKKELEREQEKELEVKH